MEKIAIEIKAEAWPFFLIGMAKLAGGVATDVKIDLKGAIIVLELPSIQITFNKISG